MPVLALRSPVDHVLGIVAPLAAAISMGTALVVDLDRNGPAYAGSHSLADLVEHGPTSAQLEPSKSGVGVLRNGGIDPAGAAEVVNALIQRWPSVVLRCPNRAHGAAGVVSLVPLLPEPFGISVSGPVAFQRTAFSHTVQADGPVLPIPRRSTIRSLLQGARPAPGDRWVRSFSSVWEM